MAWKKMPVSRTLKREVIKLAQQPGASVEWIAQDLGISVYLLERWLQAAMRTLPVSTGKSETVSSEESNGRPVSNGMDAPTRNGIGCAKVEVRSTT